MLLENLEIKSKNSYPLGSNTISCLYNNTTINQNKFPQKNKFLFYSMYIYRFFFVCVLL